LYYPARVPALDGEEDADDREHDDGEEHGSDRGPALARAERGGEAVRLYRGQISRLEKK
jgi:hypothetical protein